MSIVEKALCAFGILMIMQAYPKRISDKKSGSPFQVTRRWCFKNLNMKFILHWSTPGGEPFYTQDPFKNGNCSYSNCIVLNNKKRFKDLRIFDAIMFHGPDIWYKPSILDDLPQVRSNTQLYIYYSAESPDYYPLCDMELDNLFNMTWTYRFSSDLPSPYFTIRENGTIIGPKAEMHWKKVEDMLPINKYIKDKLKDKFKPVAWLVSICNTSSKREVVARELSSALIYFGKKGVDKYGKCSTGPQCGGESNMLLPDCWEMIESDYYFYLSFENSFDEDYVTEKVLNPLLHYTVPIVYGAANYTRFMPEGSYLDANKLSRFELAREIHNIIADKERYYNYFKWHNHYTYHSSFESPDSNPACALCEMLNRRTWNKTYKNFRQWWNLPGRCPTDTPSTIQGGLFL